MPSFILNDATFLDNIANFEHLKQSYEGKTGAKLSDPSPSKVWTSMGWNDTTTRNNQVKALVWLYKHFEDHLDFKLPSDFEAKDLQEQDVEAHNRRLHALRVLTGACIYIIEKNKTGKLVEMLKEYLGINSINNIDSETRAYCLNAVKEHFNKISDVRSYGEYDLKGIDFAFFAKLFSFANEELSKSIFTNFPCARIASVSLAWPMSMLGYSVGAFAGQAISRSTAMQNTQWTVTAAIGSFVYMVMGPTAGITLLAPTIASQTISNACGLSAAYFMGKTGEYIGYIIGATAGLPLDITWKIAKYLAAATMDFVWSSSSDSLPEKGVSLVDGTYYAHGQDFKVVSVSNEQAPKFEGLEEIDPEMLEKSKLMAELKERIAENITKSKILAEEKGDDISNAPTPEIVHTI